MSNCNNCYYKRGCIDGANYKNAESCKHYVPAADVQEVVRCKSCKYLLRDLSERKFHLCMRTPLVNRVTLDDFCSYGVRMDGEENESPNPDH